MRLCIVGLLALVCCVAAFGQADELRDVIIMDDYHLGLGTGEDFYYEFDSASGRMYLRDAADNAFVEYIDGGSAVTINVTGSINTTGTITPATGFAIPDDQYLIVGTDSDIYYGYDETTDDRAEWTDGTNLLAYLTDAGTTGTLGVSGSALVNTIGVYSGATATLYNTTATTVNAFGAATTLAVGNASGTNTILGTSNFTRVNTTGGVHVGGTSDPGADNLIVDGTSTLTGNVTTSGILKATHSTAGDVLIGLNTSNMAYVEQYSTDATAPAFIGLKGRGTKSSPTTVQNGDYLFFLGGRNYAESGTNISAIAMQATEAYSGAGRGNSISFQTCINGSTSRTTKLSVNSAGNTVVAQQLVAGSGANTVTTAAGLIDDTKIDPGTAGQIMTTNSGATASAWATPKKKPYVLPVDGARPDITAPCGTPTQYEHDATYYMNVVVADFDGTTAQYIWWPNAVVPSDYKSGTDITFYVEWGCTNASTSSAVFSVSIWTLADGESFSQAAHATASVTDANQGANIFQRSPAGTIPSTGLTAGMSMPIRLGRLPADASDTLDGISVRVNKIVMEYTADAY